ncbi:hypothetical protein GYMLUDRAFT_50311 [Collybiopsis luxurians FD-317 M1]|uniref:Uncharacterized protein n=1 Tax=Collybiopsis luxurians FD-317 M1 TaxID=944289 RepID=A0A0D0ANN3_9AGAR|nr:hypothetical protein GYMLUDRAFT_50311 [Collybiopsis luxurians FD-317 M1]
MDKTMSNHGASVKEIFVRESKHCMETCFAYWMTMESKVQAIFEAPLLQFMEAVDIWTMGE